MEYCIVLCMAVLHKHILWVMLFPQLCYGLLCPPFQYEPEKDVFNAAQSGAMAPNLVTHEFSYLIDQVRSVSPHSQQ